MKWIPNLMSQIESILFIAGDEGVTSKQLQDYLAIDNETLENHLVEMEQRLRFDESRGIELRRYAGRYQFVTKKSNAEAIGKMMETAHSQSLSQAALEVLAIIAYNQPITRVEVDEIRGVKSDSALQTLVVRALVKEVGRADGTGRAILYGTTTEFMQVFGLESLDDLPPLPLQQEDHDEETDLFMSKFQEQFEGELV